MRTKEQIRAAMELCLKRRDGLEDAAWLFYDNEAKMLRWVLGEMENAWLDGTVPHVEKPKKLGGL